MAFAVQDCQIEHTCPEQEGLLAQCEEPLRGELRSQLKNKSRLIKAGVDLQLEGEGASFIIWVLEGWIAESKYFCDGRRQIIDIILPIDLILPTGADGVSAPFTISALTDAKIASYSKKHMTEQCREQKGLQRIVNKLIAARTARQSERMLRLGQGTAYERIAHALLDLYVRLQAIGKIHGQSFRLPLTQQAIGELTGLTGVHVCRTMRRLSRNGIAEQHEHEIHIPDAHALAEACGVDVNQFRKTVLAPSSTPN